MKKIITFALFFYVTLQAEQQSPELAMLKIMKEQVNSINFEDVVFDVYTDFSKTKTFTRTGILVRRPGAHGTVVICHGYLGCKRDAIALKHLFPLYNVFAFDFRAHGQDRQGQVSTIGRDEALDVMAAVGVVKSDPLMKDLPVIAFGYSMGAVSAIQAQALDGSLFDAMILDCPYDSTDAAMRRGLDAQLKVSILGKTFDVPAKESIKNFIINHMYDESLIAQVMTAILFKSITKLDSNKVETKFVRVSPVESIKQVKVPVFFIHCENDKKVPIEALERLYANKPGFKRLWITPGKYHFGSYHHNPEMYFYKVNKFLTKLEQLDIASRVQARVCDERTQFMISSNEQPKQFHLQTQSTQVTQAQDADRVVVDV